MIYRRLNNWFSSIALDPTIIFLSSLIKDDNLLRSPSLLFKSIGNEPSGQIIKSTFGEFVRASKVNFSYISRFLRTSNSTNDS